MDLSADSDGAIISERRHAFLSVYYWSFGAWGVLAAYLGAPLLRFMNPLDAVGLAMGVGGMISTLHIAAISERRVITFAAVLFFLIFGGLSIWMFLSIAPTPAISSLANDRRCLAIQRDMLSARPRRADGPDLFQALGCRPQGEGSVYAPPTARIVAPTSLAPAGPAPRPQD